MKTWIKFTVIAAISLLLSLAALLLQQPRLSQFLARIVVACLTTLVYDIAHSHSRLLGQRLLIAIIILTCIALNLTQLWIPDKWMEMLAEGVTFGLIFIASLYWFGTERNSSKKI